MHVCIWFITEVQVCASSAWLSIVFLPLCRQTKSCSFLMLVILRFYGIPRICLGSVSKETRNHLEMKPIYKTNLTVGEVFFHNHGSLMSK